MTRLFESIGRVLAAALGSARVKPSPRRFVPNQAPPSASPGGAYPGDFLGRPEITYDPLPGDLPDPGEVVWGWVPYEEDHSTGKDRPALVIGRDADWLLALPLTSVDHDRDAAQEAGEGRYWIDVGSGPWDRQQRPSEARVDRIIRLDPASVRRVGGTLSRDLFAEVADAVRSHSQ
ncbi:MAG TPA: type II toxin-antitoxin system PemK/MazF family toxin [Propionibacteriaceae bacterium]|nr:type II toxin-antitoxin system PemK/MazF family toxin [Propionibacteriaceae bacterium]